MSLNLSKFDMKNIQFDPKKSHGPVIVLIGRRDTGKSFLVKDLLYNIGQDIPFGTVISGTEAGNGFYGELVPKILIYHEYDTSIVDTILERQQTVIKAINAENTTYGRSEIDGRTFLILDDCLYDNKWSRDKIMKMLFMNGRHWKIMLIITMQYPLGVPPNLRTNIDYTFILREPYLRNKKIIYENYAGMFPTFDSFCQIMDACTENYECLVISNNAKSNKLVDQIFWYKARDNGKFKLCLQEFWDKSKNYMEKQREKEWDGTTQRKGGIIKVNKKKW